MDKMIAEFHRDHPDIVVQSIVQPWDRRDELVATALASGRPPEVLMATRQEIVRFASEGLIVPITKYVREDNLDLERFYKSEIQTMWWDGELYSMPMPTAGGETGLMFYNRDLFQQAGLDPDSPPKTWQELDAVASKLDRRAGNGGIELMGVDIGVSGLEFIAWLYTNNGRLYSEDLKRVEFNSEQGVETLQWMLEFVQRHYGGVQNHADFLASTSGETGEDPFYQGRMGVTFRNVSTFFHIENLAPDLDYGVALRPYNGNNPKAESHGVAGLAFGWGYVIPKGLDEKVERAAYLWVRRLTYDEKGACWFMLQQARPSPIRECNENPRYEQINPHWQVVQESLERDVPVGIVPPQARILDQISQQVDRAMYGEVGAKEALDAAAEEAQRILDDYWSGR